MRKPKNNDIISKTDNRFESKDYELKSILKDDEQPDMLQIQRSSKVLLCISNGVNTLSDIADYCKISKSAAHRLLKALEKANFIIHNPFTRQYMIGELLIRVTAKPKINHEYLAINSRIELEELATMSEETISMGVMAGLKQSNVRTIPSKYDLRVVETPKDSSQFLSGALSYVFLSQIKDDDLDVFFKNIRMEPLTSFTVTNKEEILKRINEIRQIGYAISVGERIVGAMCIAAPIRNYFLPAGLAILGPEARMKERVPRLIDLLLDTANRISFNLLQRFSRYSPGG